MKKALITGITGQDGSYLAELLLEKGYEVHGIIRRASVSTTARIDHIMDKITIHEGDLSDSSSIIRIVLQVKPDEIYNLAAQSHVQVSFDAAEYTGDVDALGVLRILEAVHIAGLEKTCRIYQASTSELYGKVEECPQSETTPFHPYSPYAVAKQYGFWMIKEYREAYGMFACNQLSWHQGWTTKKSERKKSSSGGFATALSKAFVKNGGIVCSCTFLEGDFVFKAVSTEEEVECFRGSKYVKSNPKGIYRKVKKLLQEKNKVLFIGLPCQIAAVKNFVGEQNKDNLYTVDLICHGTPSVKILEKYMSQYGVSLSEIKDISFRTKNAFILKKDGKPITGHHIQDRYTMSFLSSLNYTENCYYCRYATDKRVGDITIGDAWGSDLKEEIDNGISLIMCQTEKGEELLELTPFHLCLKQKIKNMIFVFRNSKKMS